MSLRAVSIILLLLLLSAGYPIGLRAEDITTSDGRVFKNATVIKLEADGVVIKYDGGTKQIGWAQLPADLRKRFRAEAHKQKTAEIQKLKQDLARAEAEAARLDQEPEIKPKGETAKIETARSPTTTDASSASTPSTRGGHAAKATKRGIDPLEIKPDEVVDAAELIQQFTTDSAAAGERWGQRTFRVKGVIQRFEAKIFLRQYGVILESSEKFMRVVLRFDYPDDYKSIYTIQNGQKLLGRAGNKEITLMTVGDLAVFQGRCQGLRDDEIVFTGCRAVR